MADILIARIRKPHGVRGEVTAQSHTFDDSRFKKLKTVNIKGKTEQKLTLEKVRNSSNGLIIKFLEINDRDAAEALRGYEILIDESERLPLPDNEAYVDELIGMKAIDEKTGSEVGVVTEVLELPSGNIISIGLPGGEERLVHRNSPEFVRIERSQKRITVNLLEEFSRGGE
ncbi:MAG TPA: ribosome maturation factor RimM [Candidatus Kapabacteria bacterium]